MAEKWVMVRIRSKTREMLEETLQRYLRSAEVGKRFPEIDHRNERPSLDWVIRQLWLADQKHQTRAKKQREKRKQPATMTDLANP